MEARSENLSTVEHLYSLADEFRRTSERWATTLAETSNIDPCESVSDDGTLRVVVDGRPRVTELNVRADAMRRRPEELDEQLVETVSRALSQSDRARGETLSATLPAGWSTTEASAPSGSLPSRSGASSALDGLEDVVRSLPSTQAEMARRMRELAETRLTSEVEGVVVTVDGRGSLTSVRATHRALRDLDNQTFGDVVLKALNESLDQAESARLALVRELSGSESGRLDEATARFERRIGELSERLAEVERRLD